MSPIYKMYLGRYTPDWHALCPDEQRELDAAAHAAFLACGGTSLVDCEAELPNDGWQWFGVEQFPDLESAERYREQLDALSWHRYVAEVIIIGTDRSMRHQQPSGDR
jgi:hypothetical protein